MTSVHLDQFDLVFGSLIGAFPGSRRVLSQPPDPYLAATELTSEALGAKIESVSDEFFADAACLLRVPVSRESRHQIASRQH